MSSCGTPVANSTFSRPRAISPAASESTFPCSAVMMAASSSVRLLSSSRKAKSTAERRESEAARHSRAAAAALATTASTSAVLARSTSPVCVPVAGLKTGAVRPDVPALSRPSIQWGMRVMPVMV